MQYFIIYGCTSLDYFFWVYHSSLLEMYCIERDQGVLIFFFCYKICIVNRVYSKKGCFIDIFIIELNFRVYFWGGQKEGWFHITNWILFLAASSIKNKSFYLFVQKK